MAALALALVGACTPQTSPDQRGGSVDGEVEVGPRCAPSSDAAVAVLEPGQRDGCPIAVELDDDVLELHALDQAADGDELLGRGRPPSACGRVLALCELVGRVDPKLGPVLLLSQRGAESEMPVQVYLGWVEDGRLGFTETWYGLPSVVDHTRVGPPWALAPHDCGGELALLPMARLPAAEVEAPPEVLDGLAGVWTIGQDGEPQAPGMGQASGDGCRAVFSAIP